jgi:hypothetical protein
MANMKGHNGKIRSLVWSVDDSKIISCGQEGAVYEWAVQTGKREGEYVLKSCSYTGIALSPDARTTYAVGSDRMLKEIFLSESQVLRDIPANDAVLTTVALAHSGRMLFAGTSSGAVRSVKFPLALPGEWTEHQAHSASVTKMCLSADDQFLFSASEDGSLYVFRVQDKEAHGKKREHESAFAEEILVTKSDLEDKTQTITDLQARVDELKSENEYQLRLRDMNYGEKIKEVTEKYTQEMETLKTKYQVLKTEKDKEEARHTAEMSTVVTKNMSDIQDLESTNNQKLMAEYEKYQELQAKTQKMQEDYEKQLLDSDEARRQRDQELIGYYEARLKEKHGELEDVRQIVGQTVGQTDSWTDREQTDRQLERQDKHLER